MQKIENRYVMKESGLQDVPVLNQVRAGDDAVAVIDATVAAFFAGKGEVIGPKDGTGELKKFGNDIAHTGKARVRVQYTDKDNPKKILYRFEEKPATEAHLLSATYNTRSELGTDEDIDGSATKPWVHLVFEDGSQVDLEAVHVKATKTKKDDKGKD